MIVDKNKVEVKGYKGTWYVVDEVPFMGKTYFLLEHNFYGEDAPWLAVDLDGGLVMEGIIDGSIEFIERMDEELCQPTDEDFAEWQNWI